MGCGMDNLAQQTTLRAIQPSAFLGSSSRFLASLCPKGCNSGKRAHIKTAATRSQCGHSSARAASAVIAELCLAL